jgi:antitoxin CptB
VSDTLSDKTVSDTILRERAKLRWRCRRGMRELDRILEGFVDSGYEALSPAEKLQFADFLEFPDPDLHAYLVGRAEPMDSELARLLTRIRASLPAQA